MKEAKSWHSIGTEEVFKELGSNINGLTEEEAKKRLEKFSYNELVKGKKITALEIFLSQFKNFLIILLIFATIMSLFLGEIIEAIAMFSIVLLSAILGFVQEYRAEKAVEALEKMSAPTARVLRNGNELKIPARELVPGDIILIESGDIVPADSRLIEVSSLQIDEASLTGESVPSKKVIELFKSDTSVADQENMAFMSTVVTYGKGEGVVINTGMETELGKIATSIQTTKETKTPLQLKFEQMAKQIGFAVIILVFIVSLVGLLRGGIPLTYMFLFALSLAVAAVPSSLPAIVTISLAMGTKELAKRNMIIKKLPAAESLGSVTIICSDKTGTITKNQMTITRIFTDNRIINVSGTGYDPYGKFYIDGKEGNQENFPAENFNCSVIIRNSLEFRNYESAKQIHIKITEHPEKLELLLRIGYLCNNAKLVKNDGRWEIIGDPTEGSLIVLGKKGNLDEDSLKQNFSFIEELPFDSERKRMSVIFKNNLNNKTEAYVKGAPDLLLGICDKIIENGEIRKLTAEDREKILNINNSFAEKSLRVLALAYRETPNLKEYTLDNVERNLVFVGLVGMIDPPRDEVKRAVEQCQEAGIEIMIITGDHAITARAVAQQIGLFKEKDIVLTGDDIEHMTDEELEERIKNVRIMARALPIQKSRIVDALKKNGHIVAMTGDGVNDAPALKKADIGIAMGITGTDVAKEVSKATLVDDNFATIVNAVGEGRNIYDKIIKSTRFLLSCNAGEIMTVFLAIILGFPLPLIPLQILLMNLLTDGLPAVGLSFEQSDTNIMKRLPRDPREKLLSKRIIAMILIFGLIMGAGTLFIFSLYVNNDLKLAQTVAFTTLVMFEMFAVIGSRSLLPFRKLNLLSNKWLLLGVMSSIVIQILLIYWQPLQLVFGTVSLTIDDWIKILAISSLGFIVMELSKFFIRYNRPNLSR